MEKPEENYPEEFVVWFTEFYDRAPVLDDEHDEVVYCAWYAGNDAGYVDGRQYERENCDCHDDRY